MQSNLPSGYVKIAIENDHRNSGFSHKKNGGSFHSYVNVYQRVCKISIRWSMRRAPVPKFPLWTQLSRAHQGLYKVPEAHLQDKDSKLKISGCH